MKLDSETTEKSDFGQVPTPNSDDFDPTLRRAFEFAHQNVDPKLVDHSKVKIRKDSILLSGDNVFYTLQGEGPTMGLPCVFVRLHVCNLRCTWCDAFYTWNPSSEEFWTQSERYSFDKCADSIRSAWGTNAPRAQKRVIFTGGEPLIQRNQIDEVMWRLCDYGEPWELEIETNGTLMPTASQLGVAQFNCSPKLANSENHNYSMVKPKVIETLNQVNTTFKFVCASEADLDEIEQKYIPHISREKIIIMPEGIRSPEIDKHMQALYDPCMARGYRLLGRLQAQFADGARRRV